MAETLTLGEGHLCSNEHLALRGGQWLEEAVSAGFRRGHLCLGLWLRGGRGFLRGCPGGRRWFLSGSGRLDDNFLRGKCLCGRGFRVDKCLLCGQLRRLVI